MKVDIIPQKKFEQIDDNAKLSIRLTLSAEGTTKEERKALRTLWEKIDDTKDVKTLLDIMKEFDEKKGD